MDPRVPRGLEAIVLKAIQRPLDDRYADAAAMARDLERFVDGKRVRPLVAASGTGGRSLRGRRRLRASLLALVTIACGLLIVAWLLAHRPKLGQYVAAGDIDRDRDIDAVSVNAGSKSISILLNDGLGHLSVASHIEVGDTPTTVAIEDLDGDGDPDLATSDYKSRSISLLENRGGSSFRRAPRLELGAFVNSVAAGDLDGDGDGDLLAATVDRKLSLFRHIRGMDFAEPSSVETSDPPNVIVLADLDNSGTLDAITTNGADLVTTTLSVLLNDGHATFRRTDLDLGYAPWGLAAVDLDGDRLVDLAVAHPTAAHLSILRNDGGGAFAAPLKVPTGSPLQSLCAADFDGDGRIDLACAGGGGSAGPAHVCVLLGLGDTTFGAPRSLTPCPTPSSVAAVDLDGDGAPDLVVSDYGTCDPLCYYNDGKGHFGEPRAVDLSPWWRPRWLSRG